MGWDITGAGTTIALSQQIENQKARDLAEKTRAQQVEDQARVFHQALLDPMVDLNKPNMPPEFAQIAGQVYGTTPDQAQALYEGLYSQKSEANRIKQAMAQAQGVRAGAAGQNVELNYQKLAQDVVDKQYDNVLNSIKGKPNGKQIGADGKTIQVTDSKGELTADGRAWVKDESNRQIVNFAANSSDRFLKQALSEKGYGALGTEPIGAGGKQTPTQTSTVPAGWQKGTYKGQMGIFNPQTKEFKAGNY